MRVICYYANEIIRTKNILNSIVQIKALEIVKIYRED